MLFWKALRRESFHSFKAVGGQIPASTSSHHALDGCKMAAKSTPTVDLNEEIETLQSIYGDDMTMIDDPPAGTVAFKVGVVPTSGAGEEENRCAATIKIYAKRKAYPLERYVVV
jgi:hypothetical protein